MSIKLPPLSLLLSALLSVAPASSAATSAEQQKELSPRLRSLLYRSNSVVSVHEAAAVGDASVLKARLDEGQDPNYADEEGCTPLHYAARGRSARVLTLLLNAGADPLAKDAQGHTPCECCQHKDLLPILKKAEHKRRQELAMDDLIGEGNEQGVRKALKKGVNPDARSAGEHGYVLQHAVNAGQPGIVKALLKAGANVNLAPANGRTALHCAASRGDAEIIRILLAANAQPLRQSGNGSYPLHDAIWNRRTEAVRALLPAYASINFNPKGGPHGSPLSMALHYGRTEIVRAFMEAGFNPNDERLADDPPLILAVRREQVDCVKLLLEGGADRQVKDNQGKTAADYASAAIAPLLR